MPTTYFDFLTATLAADGVTISTTQSVNPLSALLNVTGYTVLVNGVVAAVASANVTASPSSFNVVLSAPVPITGFIQLVISSTTNITDHFGEPPHPVTLTLTNNSQVVAGQYATLQQLQAIYSVANINQWSTLPASSSVSLVAQQGAFDRAFNDMISESLIRGYNPPAPILGTLPPWSVLQVNLAWIEAELAGVYLYEVNGLYDQSGGIFGKMKVHRDQAWSNLRNLLFLNRGGFDRTAGVSDAVISVSPSVTPAGDPVASVSPYPIVRWNGYMWQAGTS